MAKKLVMDKVLFAVILLMLSFGAVMVYSASAVLSMDTYQNSYAFFLKHMMIMALAVAIMVIVSGIDYKKLLTKNLIAVALLASAGLLVFVLFLKPVNNTYRWIRFGVFSFQPSELAKLAIIIFTAYFISQRANKIRDNIWQILPVLVILAVYSTLIIMEPDVGTAATIIFIVMVMFFAAGVKLRYYAFAGVGLAGMIYYLIVNSTYRTGRITAFLDPWADPLGYGFQPIQSMIAIGSGGVFGTGLAKGTQKFFYLPTPHTDFIFSTIGEEMGLIGCLVLLLLFSIILWRGIKISKKVTDPFGKMLALGITIMVVGQAFLNMSVALTLLPTKGIPLPLISFGGTSMLVTLAALGILLNVSKYST